MGKFVFRVKIGDYEVEINGTREEVLNTIEELPSLIGNVHKAFTPLKPRVKLTVKKKSAKEARVEGYPKIVRTKKCNEAILRILKTDWGKWRPRTIAELKEALRSNGLSYPGRYFAGVLAGLVKKGQVRRWKTDSDHVYILAEKED